MLKYLLKLIKFSNFAVKQTPMPNKLIARQRECEELNRCITSGKSEFVIICGRRRIGKTYLVDRFFDRKFDFKFVGGHNLRTRDQLRNFAKALKKYSKKKWPEFLDWFEAFDALEEYLESLSSKRKKIIFIGEMPWMDSKRSNFVSALENFWNGWANGQYNIVLIATGSATSWMVDKLLKNRGGLHNRVTRRLYLSPFSLKETEEYMKQRHTTWDRYEILQCYMVTGGVPFYLDLIDPRETLAKNIDRLCYETDGALGKEFDELYNAIFPSADTYISVVRLLSEHKDGLTRKQIGEGVGTSGTNLTRIIGNLEKCNFIGKRAKFGNKKNEAIYRLIDFYTLFYFKFIEKNFSLDNAWWTHHLDSSSIAAWQGLTFEIICMEHHQQIKNALGISGMATSVSTWRSYPEPKKGLPGAQIDMIIERADRMIHLCEMKFSRSAYNISADYEKRLRERMWLFDLKTKNKKPLVHTFITTFGLGVGKHHNIVHSEVTMDDLFNS